jgi:hypothetical protein
MRLVLAAILALAAAMPAAAATYEIYPGNGQGPDGTFRGLLEVVENGRRVTVFRVDRGEVDSRTVLDARRAIALVVDRYTLSPERDRVRYCPQGFPPATCDDPDPEGGARVVVWP